MRLDGGIRSGLQAPPPPTPHTHTHTLTHTHTTLHYQSSVSQRIPGPADLDHTGMHIVRPNSEGVTTGPYIGRGRT